MGTAWQKSSSYPWETTRYVSGIEVIKVNITLRIYSAKWHVYAGLALLNPSAKSQIQQYATSATELFKLMVEGRGEELEDRIWGAREEVFGWRRGEEAGEGDEARAPILLSEDVLDQFSLGKATEAQSRESPNSHLSLLAMVDCWAKLGIRPYEHLDVAGTPVFMLWIGMFFNLFLSPSLSHPPLTGRNTIGVAEYLFRSPALLSAALRAALSDRVHRPDDVEFVVAARGWSECVDVGNFGWYRRRFEETSNFFAPRFDEATKLGGKMIKAIQDGMRGR